MLGFSIALSAEGGTPGCGTAGDQRGHGGKKKDRKKREEINETELLRQRRRVCAREADLKESGGEIQADFSPKSI